MNNESIETLTSAFREAMRREMSERTKRGMRLKAEAGGYPFCAPIGYRNRRDDLGNAYIEPDPQMAPLVRKAFELAAEGMPLRKILKFMTARGLRSRRGKPLGPSALLVVLTNEAYLGRTRFSGSSWKASHGPIVERAVFEAAQAGLRARKRSQGRAPRLPLPGRP